MWDRNLCARKASLLRILAAFLNLKIGTQVLGLQTSYKCLGSGSIVPAILRHIKEMNELWPGCVLPDGKMCSVGVERYTYT